MASKICLSAADMVEEIKEEMRTFSEVFKGKLALIEDTMIGQQVQVLGYQELMQEVQKRSKQTLFVYFCGSKGADGTSWCPDCVEAEPVVQAELQNLPAGSTFIYCQVGERPYWKDGNNEFRKELKVTSIPTLLKYGTSQQLVEKQCCQPELVRMLLTEEV